MANKNYMKVIKLYFSKKNFIDYILHKTNKYYMSNNQIRNNKQLNKRLKKKNREK